MFHSAEIMKFILIRVCIFTTRDQCYNNHNRIGIPTEEMIPYYDHLKSAMILIYWSNDISIVGHDQELYDIQVQLQDMYTFILY